MYFKDSRAETQKTIKFNLNEAILQIASAVFTIKNMNFTMFTENQEDIYFVTQNAYADFYEALENSSNMYV